MWFYFVDYKILVVYVFVLVMYYSIFLGRENYLEYKKGI